MRPSLIILLSFILFSSPHRSFSQHIEIVLHTDGNVALTGTTSGSKVTASEEHKPTTEQMVKQRGDSKEVKIFTTPADAQKKRQHEKLDIQIPDRSIVSLQTQKGNVSLSDIDAYVSGLVKSGTLSLKNLRGEIELVNDQGDIEATGVEARGMLVARNGNIQLTDVSGEIAPHAPKGRLALVIGPNYYKKSPKPFDIALGTGDVEIATAPYGGKIQLGSGSVKVSDIRGKLAIEAKTSTVTLLGLAAPLSLHNRGDVGIQLGQFEENSAKNSSVEIEMESGDLTLELMKNFSGTLQIEITETNPKGEKAGVESTIDLGEAGVVENRTADKSIIIRESIFNKAIGKGGPIVRARVFNGQVIIKN